MGVVAPMLMKLKKLKMANVSKLSSGLGFDLLRGLSVGFGLASLLTLLTSLGFLPLAAGAQPAQKSDHKSGQNSNQNTNQNTGKLQSRQDQLQTYLDRQTAREKERYKSYYESMARNELEAAQARVKQIKDTSTTRNQLEWSRNTDGSYVPLHERFPGYVPYSIREGQKGGAVGTGKIRPYSDSVTVSPELEMARLREQMAEEKAEELRQRAKDKQAEIDRTMQGMQSQMVESAVPGAAVLKPNGSNLYVRYYGSEGEKAAQPGKPSATGGAKSK